MNLKKQKINSKVDKIELRFNFIFGFLYSVCVFLLIFNLGTNENQKASISRSLLLYFSSLLVIVFSFAVFPLKYILFFKVTSFVLILLLAHRCLKNSLNPTLQINRLLDYLINFRPGFMLRWYRRIIFSSFFKNLNEDEEFSQRVELFGKFKTYTLGVEKRFSSSQVPTVIYIVNYLLIVGITLFLFAVLIKTTVFPAEMLNSDRSSDYLLGSILQFTNADGNRVFGNEVQIDLWVLGFERIMAFYYLVIAILAFSSSNSEAVEEVKEKVNFLLKKHYNHFARNSVKYIQHKGIRKLMTLEEFKEDVESLKKEIED